MEVDGVSYDRVNCDLWISIDKRIVVRRICDAETFCAEVDGDKLRNKERRWRRFRLPETAMKAAAHAKRLRDAQFDKLSSTERG